MEIINCTNSQALQFVIFLNTRIELFTENRKSFLCSPISKGFCFVLFCFVGGRGEQRKKKRSCRYLQIPGYQDLKEKEAWNVPSHIQSCSCSAVMWHLMLQGTSSITNATKSLIKRTSLLTVCELVCNGLRKSPQLFTSFLSTTFSDSKGNLTSPP